MPVIAVPPQYTTPACSGCGTLVQKSLSTRTHGCWHCGLVLDRDEHAARNILALALVIWAQLTPLTSGSSQGSSGTPRTAGQAGTGPGSPGERLGTGGRWPSLSDGRGVSPVAEPRISRL